MVARVRPVASRLAGSIVDGKLMNRSDRDLPLVSVLVPTYNQREFVGECLDSVLNQEYPRLQIVVSDDASTDGTQEVLRAYAARYPEVITYLAQPVNLGITGNCNAALEACTGRYIALFAGDDLMLPGKISRQVEMMESDPECVICYHNLEVFDSSTGRTLRLFNTEPDVRLPRRLSFRPREGGADQFVRYGTFSGGCSLMVRRAACPEYGWDTRIKVASDWLFWIEIATRGTIKYIPEVLGRYRRHAMNATGQRLDGSEQLLTLDIVDEKYPTLRRASRAYRAKHYFRRGIRNLLEGEMGAAAHALRLSLRWGMPPLRRGGSAVGPSV